MGIKSHKVYKGIQREIRFLYLERSFALNYLLCTAIINGTIVLCFGLSFTTVLIALFIAIINNMIFQVYDKKNTKHNFKKSRINQRKPQLIKTTKSIIIKQNGSVLNKR